MCAQHQPSKPAGLLTSIVTNRCPRCRQGKLFIDPNPYHLRTTMRMYEHCPVCHLKYERETGFFFGTGYVSYALSVLLIMVCFIVWSFTIGLSLDDNSIFLCLGASALVLVALQPLLQRLSRSIWISIFVRYEPRANKSAVQ